MSRNKVYYVKIPINFTEDDLKLIEKMCNAKNLSKADVVRLCVRNYADMMIHTSDISKVV